MNKKTFHSVNLWINVDYNKNFMMVNIIFLGSTHDPHLERVHTAKYLLAAGEMDPPGQRLSFVALDIHTSAFSNFKAADGIIIRTVTENATLIPFQGEKYNCVFIF